MPSIAEPEDIPKQRTNYDTFGVKRIRTEEPDEVVPHVRICGEGAG